MRERGRERREKVRFAFTSPLLLVTEINYVATLSLLCPLPLFSSCSSQAKEPDRGGGQIGGSRRPPSSPSHPCSFCGALINSSATPTIIPLLWHMYTSGNNVWHTTQRNNVKKTRERTWQGRARGGGARAHARTHAMRRGM